MEKARAIVKELTDKISAPQELRQGSVEPPARCWIQRKPNTWNQEGALRKASLFAVLRLRYKVPMNNVYKQKQVANLKCIRYSESGILCTYDFLTKHPKYFKGGSINEQA